MNRLELLNALQRIDIRIEENRRATQEAQTRLANDAALVAARNDLDVSKRQTGDRRARLRMLELEADGIGERIKELDARLYGGRVSNPKELDGLQHEELMLKRQKSEIEDRMLELMAEIETAEVQVKAKSKALEKITAEWAASMTHDQAQLAELASGLEKLTAQREHLRTQIASADLQVYDDLTRAKKGRPGATIKGVSCSACGFQVPSGVASRTKMGELAFCTNCGRILVP